MNKQFALRIVFCVLLGSVAALAQSGDISGSTSQVTTLGVTILKLVMGLVLLACVGVIAWGGVTIATNRPKGLAMVAGGVVAGLIAGLSYALVGTTSGATPPSGFLLLFPH